VITFNVIVIDYFCDLFLIVIERGASNRKHL